MSKLEAKQEAPTGNRSRATVDLGLWDKTTMNPSKIKVLFLCTGNAARSQIAEALARLDHGDALDPVSAGSRPAFGVHSLAVDVMAELGSDIAGARSKSAEEFREQVEKGSLAKGIMLQVQRPNGGTHFVVLKSSESK